QTLADKEAAAAAAGPALAAQVAALVLLRAVLLFAAVEALLGGDGQITVLEVELHLVLLKARQVNVELVGAVLLADIGLHDMRRALAVQRIARAEHGSRKHVIKKFVEKIFTKKSGQ